MPQPHQYRLKYDLTTEPGKFTADEIKKSGKGATDALIHISILYPADGSLSVQFTSFDGRNDAKHLSDAELFKIWMLLGKNLSQRETLDPVRRELASMPSDAFFKVMG